MITSRCSMAQRRSMFMQSLVGALVGLSSAGAIAKDVLVAITYKSPPTIASAAWQELSCASLASLTGNPGVLKSISSRDFPYATTALRRLQAFGGHLMKVELDADPEAWSVIIAGAKEGGSLKVMASHAFEESNRWWTRHIEQKCGQRAEGCANDYFVMQGCKVIRYELSE